MSWRGTSAGEACPNTILLTLMNRDLGFEELVDALKNEYSRGTVNKYLNRLFDEQKIDRKARAARRRGSYYLTQKGRKEANLILPKKTLIELPHEILQKFILKYKILVTHQIIGYFDSLAAQAEYDQYIGK